MRVFPLSLSCSRRRRSFRIFAMGGIAALGLCAQQPAARSTEDEATPAAPPAANEPLPTALGELANQFKKTPDVVVAEVAGTPITLGMVGDEVNGLPAIWGSASAKQIFDIALADLIQHRMLALKAKELGLDKTPDVQRALTEATDRELSNALMQNIINPKMTDKMLQDRYTADFAGKPGPEEIWIRIIGTATEAEAEEAQSKIKGGMDFASAVQAYSRDPSRATGGDLGYLTADKLPPVMRAVAFALPVGEVSAYPVQSNGLWYIVEVEGRRQRQSPPLQDVKSQLMEDVARKAIRDYVTQIRDSSAIKIYGPTGRDSVKSGKSSSK